MRAFKVIKEYPGSPPVGTIYEEWSVNTDIYRNKGVFGDLSFDHIKNYPEFWEEIKKLDYQILQIANWNKTGYTDVYDCETPPTYNDLIRYKIFTVKRLSDGLIFKVGDSYKCASNGLFTIEGFKEHGNSLTVTASTGGFTGLNSITPTLFFYDKKGQSVFANQLFYSVCKNTFKIKEWILTDTICNLHNQSEVNFKDRKNAEEYIILNKKVLSAQEVIDLLGPRRNSSNFRLKNSFIKLAESKINK